MRLRVPLRTCAGVLLVVAAFLGAASRGERVAPERDSGLEVDAGLQALEVPDRWRDAAPEERDAYVEWFRATLEERHEAALAAYTERRQARRRESMDSLVAVFNLLYFAVPAVLVLPLVYWKRFRGRRLKLAAYSFLSSTMLAVAVLAFTLAVGLLKEFSLELSAQMDPQLATLNATFGVLHEHAHEILVRDDLPAGLALRQLEGGADGPFTLLLLFNLTQLHERVFDPALEVYWYWQALVEYLPHVLSVVMALLFAWGVRRTLHHTWTMPLRAASGVPGAARRAIRLVGSNCAKEVLAIVSLLVVLIVLNPLASLAMQGLVWPSVEGLFAFCGAAVGMLNVQAEPSVTWLVLAMTCVPVFLIAGALTIAVASVLFLVRTLDVTRQRWHDGVPIRSHRAFWRQGTWALVRAQWIPVLFAAAVLPWIASTLPTVETAHELGAEGRIVSSILALWGGGLFVFWLLRGPRALWDLARPGLTRIEPRVAADVEAVTEPTPESTTETRAA